MSLWNRIGDVASTIAKDIYNPVEQGGKNLFKFGGEVLNAAGGIARIGWDIGTAPFNDNAEYDGFIRPIKTALSKESPNIVKPFASAGGAIMKVPGVAPVLQEINHINETYIREPATTYNLVLGDVLGGKASFFDPNEWKKAYTGAQDISIGQALQYMYRSAYQPKFNIYDPREREKAFKTSAWGKAISGGTDLYAQFFGDVSLGLAKGLKVAKASELGVGKLNNADAVAKAAEDITKAQFGVKNRFTKVIDDFTKNDSVYAINHPMVKSSDQPGLLAHLLGDSVDRDETALILRSALGDPAAMDELALQRAYLSDALKAARADLSAVDEYKLFAAPDGSGMLPFLNDNPAVTEEALRNYESLAKTDKYFADLMTVGNSRVDEAGNIILGGGSLSRTTGTALQGAENFIAEARALKFYDKKIGNPRVDVYQPTPFHRLYQKISWNQNERPAGLVDFNDPDSYKEIMATINLIGPERGGKLVPRSIRGLGLFDEAETKQLLDTYMSASTPEARSVATLNLENQVFRRIAEKYGFDEEQANRIYNNYNGARTSALKSIKDKGFMVDTDGSIIKAPVFESQTANYLPLMDFQLMDNLLRRNSSVLRAISGGTKDTVIHYADVLQDAFKAGALLRLGYTMRNGIDSQLRIAASVGSLATLRHFGPGLKNLVFNTIQTPSRLVDNYRPAYQGLSLKEVQKGSQKIINELKENKQKIAELEAKYSINQDDLELLGELNTARLLQEEKQSIYNHYADVLNKAGKTPEKRRIATGTYRITTTDGQVYDIPDAFGGKYGDMWRKLASSGNSFERIVDSNTDLYARKMASKGIGAIRPSDPGYFEQWAQTLRNQFANSQVVKQLIDGRSIDDVATWLRNTPAGRDLRKRLGVTSSESTEYVTKASGFLDQYLPVSSNLRGKISEITAEDLRSVFKDPTDMPIIHGHVLEENLFNPSDRNIKKLINGAFKLLGTMPEDAWARNPLYVHFYRKEAERRINIIAELKGNRLNVADQEAVMSASHKVALREMKNILFNIERRTNLAAAMKYLSPFISAQENAYKTWMKLAVANPAVVNRGYMVWQAPNKAGLVTDQDGNPVPEGKTSGNDVIWVGLPKGMTKISGLNSLTELGIPKGSLDILFQGGMDALYNRGNPNIVSDIFPVGPYVAVPVGEIAKRKPSFGEAMRWAIPFGAPRNVVSGFLPSWAQKAEIAKAGLDDAQFARTYQLIWTTEQTKAKKNGEPPVPPNKILKMTQDYWKMRISASVIMPFAPRFDSPYKFYLDKSREYKRKFGLDADAKFLQDFPEFFQFSASLSSNPTGVQNSIAATKNIDKYGDLIGSLSKVEPKLIGLIVNDPSGYDFSQNAYDYLYNKRISPDSPQKFLSSQSPAESQRKNDAEKGWIKYNQLMDDIDNELARRRLSSIQQSGAEDLKYLKEQVIQKLSIQTDIEGKPIFDKKTGQYQQTAWYDDYLDSDGSKTNRVVVGLAKILNDEKFMKENGNKTTWKSIASYFDLRKDIANDLAKRQVKSLDAKSNADLRYIYDNVVNKLKQDDKLGFAYMYDRFLSQDLIYDKYLTPKEGQVK